MTNDLTKLVEMLFEHTTPSDIRRNYIVPGLHSIALATPTGGGLLRMFDMNREQEVEIVPHSHRYDFKCFVMQGVVRNTTYNVVGNNTKDATHAMLQYDPATKGLRGDAAFVRATQNTLTYREGDWYSMQAEEFHRIHFSNNAKVLFLEGSSTRPDSAVLLPVVDGELLDTYYSRDWMMSVPR